MVEVVGLVGVLEVVGATGAGIETAPSLNSVLIREKSVATR